PFVVSVHRCQHDVLARTLFAMSMSIQIYDVPEPVYDAIAARAAARGQSMQDYLRALLEREFRARRNDDAWETMTGHRSLGVDAHEITAQIRAGRDSAE